MDPMDELAHCLRTWRDRLTPEEAGLPNGGRRRAPGLRREELANLAGALGRLPRPARAGPRAQPVRLRARLAGPRAAAERGRARAPVPRRRPDAAAAGKHRPLPHSGRPARAGGHDRRARARQPTRRGRSSPPTRSRGSCSARSRATSSGATSRVSAAGSSAIRETDRRFQQEAVADLHDALGRYPDDEPLRELIAGLRERSPVFAELWEQRPDQAAARRPQDVHPPRGRPDHARLRHPQRARERPAADRLHRAAGLAGRGGARVARRGRAVLKHAAQRRLQRRHRVLARQPARRPPRRDTRA